GSQGPPVLGTPPGFGLAPPAARSPVWLPRALACRDARFCPRLLRAGHGAHRPAGIRACATLDHLAAGARLPRAGAAGACDGLRPARVPGTPAAGERVQLGTAVARP